MANASTKFNLRLTRTSLKRSARARDAIVDERDRRSDPHLSSPVTCVSIERQARAPEGWPVLVAVAWRPVARMARPMHAEPAGVE